MATIKSYTDIEQSKKLAEILPLESADMDYIPITNIDGEYAISVNEWDNEHIIEEGWIPCWSLAALLEQLKSEIILKNKQILFLHLSKYDDNSYEIRYTNSWTGEVFITEADNPIDACVTMIEKLHEHKML